MHSRIFKLCTAFCQQFKSFSDNVSAAHSVFKCSKCRQGTVKNKGKAAAHYIVHVPGKLQVCTYLAKKPTLGIAFRRRRVGDCLTDVVEGIHVFTFKTRLSAA